MGRVVKLSFLFFLGLVAIGHGFQVFSRSQSFEKSDEEELIEKVITDAKSYLGTPYLAGGKSPKGFDCSGFVWFVFKKNDISLPRSSREMRNVGKEIALEDAAPGDIALFKGSNLESQAIGHAALVTSTKNQLTFIHASTKYGIKYDQLTTAYYQKRLVSIRRVIPR